MLRPRLSSVLTVLLTAALCAAITASQVYAATESKDSLSELTTRAERGDANAQEMLGIHYWNTKSPEDMPKAIKWLTKAAEQDDGMAQSILAHIYAVGEEGTEQDYEVALMWYQKAANHGFADAMQSVANLYEKGLGARQSNEEAYYWLSLAALYPGNNSKLRLSELSGHLSPEQISAIQQRVNKWRSDHLKQQAATYIDRHLSAVCHTYYADVDAVYWHIKYPPAASPVPVPPLSELERVADQTLKTVLTANSSTDGKEGILAVETDKSAEEVLRQHPRALYAGIRAYYAVGMSYQGETVKNLTTYIDTKRSDAFSQRSPEYASFVYTGMIPNPETNAAAPYSDSLREALTSLSCDILINSAGKECRRNGKSITVAALPRSCP